MMPTMPVLAGGRSASAVAPLLLDIYGGAVAAWSVARKLKNGAGLALRVRTSGDSYATGTDIGFSGSDMDTTALLAAVGGGNTGVVEAIYDQVGSSTLAQSTNADRPTIVAAGALNTLGTNSKAAIVLDSSDSLSTASARPNFGTDLGLSGDCAFSIFAVYRKTSAAAGCAFGWGDTGTALRACGWYDDNSTRGVAFAGGNNFVCTAPTTSTHYLLSIFKSAGSTISAGTSVNRNGASVASSGHSTSNPNINGAFPMVAGRWANFGSNGLQGELQELIVFAGDKRSDSVAIETDINAFYGIF